MASVEVGEGVEGGESMVWKEEDPIQRFPNVSTRAKAPSPLTNAMGARAPHNI